MFKLDLCTHAVCRVCLNNASKLYSVNEVHIQYQLTLMEMLEQTVMALKEFRDVPLSQEICDECRMQLIAAYDFQRMCISAAKEMFSAWRNSQNSHQSAPVNYDRLGIDAMEIEESKRNVDFQSLANLDPIKIENVESNFLSNETSVEAERSKDDDLQTSSETKVSLEKLEKSKTPALLCNLCGKSYKANANLLKHMEKCHKENLLDAAMSVNKVDDDEPLINLRKAGREACKICPKTNDESIPAKPKCDICAKEFCSVNMLRKHKRSKHEDVTKIKSLLPKSTLDNEQIDDTETNENTKDQGMENYANSEELDEANNSDSSLGGLNDSTNSYMDDKERETPLDIYDHKYKCTECTATFRFSKQLERHQKKHAEAFKYVCLVCSDRFKYPFMLQKHMDKHHAAESSNQSSDAVKKEASKKSHFCNYCAAAYTNVGGLAQHMSKKHPDIIPFKCDKCDKTFVVEEHLKIHTNRHMGIKNFKCELCEKSFSFKFAMKQHMRIHTGDLNYLCTLCGKKFYRPSNLRQHMQRHGDDKPYTCPHCPKRFKCPSDRYIHLMSHQEGKNHVCSTCGARFSRVDSLHQHQILHTGEKPFKCDQCPMAFPRLMNLNRHLRTHTGEKPYKCQYCEKAYAQSNDLNKHLRSHVGENTYKCSQCPEAFKYQAELRNHECQHYRLLQEAEKTEQITKDCNAYNNRAIND